MIYAIIGQRGVGKTHFLKKIARLFELEKAAALFFDLDTEIEKTMGERLPDLFTRVGEQQFRNLEAGTFKLLYERHSSDSQVVVIALGAGFEFDLPNDVHVLWLRRSSDQMGRIFLDRPRLNPTLRPLEEFSVRARSRAIRFQAFAHEHYFLREGIENDDQTDAIFFGFQAVSIGGSLTVLPWMLYESFFRKRIAWGVRYFELRDDLLTREQIDQALAWIPENNRLLARRRRESLFSITELQNHKVDWPLELGVPPKGIPDLVLSLHDRSKNLEQDLVRLSAHSTAYLKCAPKIWNLAELRAGHRWWNERPDRRSFLPNSLTGEFQWYRCLFGRQMEIAFFREDDGTSLDQPILADWLRTESFEKYFAAILGDPVEHSWTPAEHEEFFASYKIPVVRIRLPRETAPVEALKTLREFGLIAAAVTSPHKQSFMPGKSINTIAWDFVEGQWKSTNTDGSGLQAALNEVKAAGLEVSRWAVWGGGGTLPVLQEHLPTASYFAVRTGAPRSSTDTPLSTCDGLIWAAGGDAEKLPPESFRPLAILDLSYSENSLGLECAQKTGARYFSGRSFFKAQAAAQREFFQQFLLNIPRTMATNRHSD